MGKYIDSRDLAKRLEELQDERQELLDAIEEAEQECEDISDVSVDNSELEENVTNAKEVLQNWDNDNLEEMQELESLENEISEWSYGNTLIPEEDFVDYCQELCEDIGDVSRGIPGYIVIDWDATADNIKADYSEVEYQGNTYLVRD